MNKHSEIAPVEDSAALLPSTIEVEQALLGAVLRNNDAYWTVANALSPVHFSEPVHQQIYAAATRLIGEGRTAQPGTISPLLHVDKIGSLTPNQYLARMQAEAVNVVNAPDFAAGVIDGWMSRQGIATLQDGIRHLISLPLESSPRQALTEIAQALSDLIPDDDARVQSVAYVVNGMRERMVTPEVRPYVPLVLPELRDIMGGEMEAKNLYGMLSSSGEGKTSLALQIMWHAAKRGRPVIFLSYDQSAKQCVDQWISQQTGIENTRIRNRTLNEREWDQYWRAHQEFEDLPIWVRECSGATDTAERLVKSVRSIVKRNCRKFEHPPLVVLDHCRKVKPANPNAHEGRIAAESNGLFKDAAKQLDLVWFSLMQRGSKGTQRRNPRPIDDDIYGGESAKEDYDGVFYLYRGYKYRKKQLATAADDNQVKAIEALFIKEKWEEDEAEVGALKARYADPDKRFRLRFNAPYTRYESKREELPAGFDFGELTI